MHTDTCSCVTSASMLRSFFRSSFQRTRHSGTVYNMLYPDSHLQPRFKTGLTGLQNFVSQARDPHDRPCGAELYTMYKCSRYDNDCHCPRTDANTWDASLRSFYEGNSTAAGGDDSTSTPFPIDSSCVSTTFFDYTRFFEFVDGT